jgi:eukaryotic-like serine/threonine-protein kinase
VMAGTDSNIWIGETAGGPLTQLTFGNDDVAAVFTPGGKEVLYTHGEGGTYNVFSISADGSGTSTQLTRSPNTQRATSVDRQGRWVLLNDISDKTGVDILKMQLGRGGIVSVFRQTEHRETAARFSPDGRWVAYDSNDTGRAEVYVEAFPGPGSRRQVSFAGGSAARWNSRGTELFYQGSDAILAVPVQDGRATGPPVTIVGYTRNANALAPDWTISPDGRLLVLERQTPKPSEIKLLLNLFNEIKN